MVLNCGSQSCNGSLGDTDTILGRTVVLCLCRVKLALCVVASCYVHTQTVETNVSHAARRSEQPGNVHVRVLHNRRTCLSSDVLVYVFGLLQLSCVVHTRCPGQTHLKHKLSALRHTLPAGGILITMRTQTVIQCCNTAASAGLAINWWPALGPGLVPPARKTSCAVANGLPGAS
jgi:hypothetical protein